MIAPLFLKRALSENPAATSSTGATAAFPLPTPSVDPTPAGGLRGPKGLSPRQNYSRVNTGTPPSVDAGSAEQKSMAPRGAEMLPKRASGEELMGKMAGRPTMQELVKAAMVESAGRVRVSEEARLQSEKTASSDETCSKCKKAMAKCACGDKMASAILADDHVTKLAGALDYIAAELSKEANIITDKPQSLPPGVSASPSGKTFPEHQGQGVHVVPMNPDASQKGMGKEHGHSQMANDEAHGPFINRTQVLTNTGSKSLGVAHQVRAKLAEKDPHEKKETEGLEEAKRGVEKAERAHESEPENKAASVADYMRQVVTKQAEEADASAHISAGKATAPETDITEMRIGNPVGGPANGPKNLVSNSKDAIDYTKRQSYVNKREDLKRYFEEPAMSAAHDKTLSEAFEHTNQAGAKIAFAQPQGVSVKAAAARVLLTKVAQMAEEKKNQNPSSRSAGL